MPRVVASSLDSIFSPKSVAVIGASATPGSVGSILMRNLMENPFGGVVFPVNPKRRAIHGVLCYPTLQAVPERVDLAVIATPAATVPSCIRDCVERGVKSAIVISAGFSELGTQGQALERQIRDLARGKMRVIGPNCLGVIHPPSRLNASFAADMPRQGSIALLSQSGAICTSILDWARETHVGFSSFVSVGAMVDVDFADLIDYFGDDPTTRSILIYMESIGDVRKFLSAARNVARTKPVILVKSGRHEAGARAAASHTGALAGADAVFDAAFRRAGVLRVITIRELFNMAEILAMQPQPAGPNLAIITNAGGPGVMATDDLMTLGGQLAPLTDGTVAALNAVLPPFWSHSNPVDVLGDAAPERYRAAVENCMKDPGIQGVLVMLTPQAMSDPTETAKKVAEFARGYGKPILAAWMGGTAVRAGRDLLQRGGVPTFDTPESAVRAFLNMVQFRRNQDLLYETPASFPDDWSPHLERARATIAKARSARRLLLTEVEAKEMLSAYGIPTVPTIAARSEDEAVAAANSVGYPVVLKLLSETVTHKSDVGGVQLGLADAAAVGRAYHQIQENVKHLPGAFDGVAVQPMVSSKGLELIVGSSIDHQFGPVILFGSGGILVEVFQDRALALPPLNRTLARRLMERTRIYKALQGVRGRPPVNMDHLEMILVRFSQMLTDLPEIQEVDINPLLASHDGIIALDARVLLADEGSSRPQLAIHPYPNHLTTEWKLEDGTELTIRAVRPEDEPHVIELFGTFSERTIRLRYFSLLKRLSHDSLIRLCHLDYDREMALVAVRRSGDGPRFLGVSRYILDPETMQAEYAVVVGDPWQGKGLGRHLMERVIEVARLKGVRRLVGPVLRDNTGMLTLARQLGFSVSETSDPAVVDTAITL